MMATTFSQLLESGASSRVVAIIHWRRCYARIAVQEKPANEFIHKGLSIVLKLNVQCDKLEVILLGSLSLRHQQFTIPPEVLLPFLELGRLSDACIPLPASRHGTLPS